jgi:O-antigen/teichoic acid export membrane protein
VDPLTPGAGPANALRALVKASLVYSIGAIAGKAFGIVFLPILTRLLSPEDLGRVDITTTFATAVGVLAGGQLDFAVTRVFFDVPSGRPRRVLLGTFLSLLVLTTLPLFVIIVVFREAISSVVFGSPAFDGLIVGGGALLVGSVFRIAVLTIARTLGRASDYAWLSGGSLMLSGVLAVGFLSLWQRTAISAVVAYALAFGTTAIVGWAILREDVTPSISRANTSILLRFGLPLLPAAVAAIGAELVNRTVLLQGAGASQVAYLGVALRFASIAGLAIAAFQLAWQPRAYAIYETDAGRRQIAGEGFAFLVLLSALLPMIGAATPEGLKVLAGPGYEVAGPATSFALVAVLASGGFLVASMSSLLARDARSVGIAMGLGVAVAVVANVALAREFGGAGTAAAMAIGQGLSFGTVAALGRRGIRLPIPWLRVASTMGAASLLTVAFTMVSMPLAVRIAAVAIFLVVVASMNQPRVLFQRLRMLMARGPTSDTAA